MPGNTQPAGQCPKCQGTAVVCRFNFFDRGDLQVHSWEHKCPDCGWRDTKAFRSDEPHEKQSAGELAAAPGICPLCGRTG